MNPELKGSSQRTFKNAVAQLLEQDYGLVGSRRVLALMAEDIQALAAQFFPAGTHVQSGWMVFTGTKVTGRKARPGTSAADYPLVTLTWPVLLPEDIETLCQLPPGEEGRRQRKQLLKKRLLRIIEYGLNHADGPVALTNGDLGLMLGRTASSIGFMLKELRQETGRPLLTKGYFFDQGVRPTHKAQIVSLYEQGVDEADITRLTNHSQSSVGRYLRDYERVKLMLTHGVSPEEIPLMIDMQTSIVKAYVALVRQFHPSLLEAQLQPSAKT